MVFCFGYAAVSAGFTIVWALAALNIFDEEAPDNRAHTSQISSYNSGRVGCEFSEKYRCKVHVPPASQ